MTFPPPAPTAAPAASPLERAGSLAGLFRLVAAERPGATALSGAGEDLSYAALDAASDRLAERLAGAGVRPGDRVGLLLERSLDIPVAILGVLKAGAAYVPLDPAHPPERLRFMTADARLHSLVGDPAQARERGLGALPVLTPRDTAPDTVPAPGGPPALLPDAAGTDPAYVIYTSGSTGRPKGCVVTHHNVLALLRSALPLFDTTAADRWALFHAFSFDVSVWELWAAFATGATAVVVPQEAARSPIDFLGLLAERRVTVLGQVPSVFRALAMAHEAGGRPELALRYLVFAGESIDLDVVRDFLAAYRGTPPTAVNMYGPTETTVYATHRVLTADDLSGQVRSPIGRELPHLRIELRDAAGPVPDGEPGELCVAGEGLAEGYFGLPELTAERFVTIDGPHGPVRWYRTGDLARRLPDGSLEYLGRDDQQIKLRGYRIELEEIEAALRAHAAVRDVAVTVITTPAGASFLVACVVPADGAPDDPAESLRAHAAVSLPRYMTPDRYKVIPDLPLTSSGKLDRNALRELAARRRAPKP